MLITYNTYYNVALENWNRFAWLFNTRRLENDSTLGRPGTENAKKWLSVAISNSDSLPGTLHHVTQIASHNVISSHFLIVVIIPQNWSKHIMVNYRAQIGLARPF